MYEGYLPISKQDMQERGIKQLDFVYVCGDAYVDHPSFGHAIIARLLEAHGYTVGIIAQPDWKDDASISVLGVPRLGFLVSAGNMDSMVNHYSVSKKRRATDSYTPGGVMGKRPDYATVVYCNLIRHTYKKTPIIIGGIEASLRRLAHYDYWSNKVKRSILLDSGADLISYGMGEHSIIEIADALNAGIDVHDITFIDGTVFKTKNRDLIYDAIELPDYDEIKENKRSFAQSFYKQYCNTDPFSGKRLFEPYGGTTFVVQNPPAKPLTQTEMDEVYALPYMRNYHPSYEKDGGVPAIREIKFSLISNRGCFGGCSFCALTFHQGRIIQTRSHESIIDEAKQIIQGEIAMKNILKIMLMMITIFTIAGSAVYAAEIPVSDQDQLITSRDWTEISNLQDEMKKEEPDATIDYDKALKVYVDCNLIKLQTADTKKLTSALESANYVWVIPFKMEKTYGMFTVAKGLPLSEEAKSVLTKAEQEEVKNHAGKWMITETAEHTVEPYYDILLEKREALSDCTRVVLVGSQPGMRQPVALGMDDETARIWISLGYQYPVMEKIPETQNVESGVYSFDSVAEISDTYIEDSEVSTGAGVQSRSSMKYVAGIGIIVIGSILILSVLKKKKLEDYE